jgi:hypothetical protein
MVFNIDEVCWKCDELGFLDVTSVYSILLIKYANLGVGNSLL